MGLAWASIAPASKARRVIYIDIETPGAREAYARFHRALEARRLGARFGIEPAFLAIDQTKPAELENLPARVRAADPWMAIATSLPTAKVVRAMGIPALFYSPADPVALGLAESVRRPGGAMTGYASELASPQKMLELLADAFPGRKKIAVVSDRLYAAHVKLEVAIPAEGRRSGRVAELILVDTLEEFDAFARGRMRSFEALAVPYTAVPFRHGERMLAAVREARVPAIYGSSRLVREGGLMGLEADIYGVGETFVRQLEQVALGTPPGEIPVERPLRFPITINLGTAAAMGVTFPPAFLKRADHVLR